MTVFWHNIRKYEFAKTNGLKQGGVINSLLFNVLLDHAVRGFQPQMSIFGYGNMKRVEV